MKKKFLITAALLCLICFASACKESGSEPKEPDLLGTTWKLQYYYDIEANELIYPIPYNDNCYELKFDTDGKVFAQVLYEDIFIFEHLLTNSAKFLEWNVTNFPKGEAIFYYYAMVSLIGINIDEEYVTDILISQVSYSVDNNTLKIYYTDIFDNDRKKYLMYRRM